MTQIKLPDIGTTDAVDILEIHIEVGQTVALEDPLITLEGDKATMEVPSPQAATIERVLINVGDKIRTGDPIAEVTAMETNAAAETQSSPASSPSPAAVEQTINLPDIGTTDAVEIIELAVAAGDTVAKDKTLLTLEGDKATMDIPSPMNGEIISVLVNTGDKIVTGQPIFVIKGEQVSSPVTTPTADASKSTPVDTAVVDAAVSQDRLPKPTDLSKILAGPAVRRVSREFGIDLTQVTGSGRKGRILVIDCQNYVKSRLSGTQPAFASSPEPSIDFSKFGEIEAQPLSKIKRLTGANMHRNWVTIPHVTHFDSADITALEALRQREKIAAQQSGVKLTPLVYVMKAVVASLKAFPTFNASLDSAADQLILKKYFHLGVAVDTEQGLVVPVIRDVDQKSHWQLAKELASISHKAREKGLSIADMDGSCITISSLGGIGGTGFTPIVKAPDVAIVGISKSRYEPVYEAGTFVPRLMLPFSLSYDHRVIDGAEAARFCRHLAECLTQIETILKEGNNHED